MPRKLALKADEGSPSTAAALKRTPAGERKRSKPRAGSALQTGQAVRSAKLPKIGFDQSSDKKDTDASEKHKAGSRRNHVDGKLIESHLQRQCFAKNFRAARKDAGLSQRDIQTKTGIPQSHISEIESAMHNICIETMVKLANLVHIPVHELLKP
jgi:ribosome-binding protein aMBF1 (putative translation factor)